jgi:citrate lyase beta subunit
MLEPVLFSAARDVIAQVAATTDPELLPAAVVVDWEHQGKPERQGAARRIIGMDTSLHADRPEDLERVSRAVAVPVVCRLDAPGPATADQLDLAVSLGATEVLLPMVRHPDEVERALQHSGGRVGVGIMVETAAAVEHVSALSALPLSRAYLGLVDLALDRGTRSIFTALVDGTAEHVASALTGTPFGAGGLTLAHGGAPIPAPLLAGELVRLGCAFSFLRRSFLRDLAGTTVPVGIADVRQLARSLAARTPEQVAVDRRAFTELVRRLEGCSP